MRSKSLTFVGAQGLVSVLDRTASDHRLAADLWRLELDGGATLVTTSFAAFKASLALQERHGLVGVRALQEMVLPAMRLEWCTRTDYALSVTALLASGDARKDLVEHLDEQVRRRLQISRTLLSDFTETG